MQRDYGEVFAAGYAGYKSCAAIVILKVVWKALANKSTGSLRVVGVLDVERYIHLAHEVAHVHALTHFGTYQFKLRIQVTGQAAV